MQKTRLNPQGFPLVDKNLAMRKLTDPEQHLDQIREFSKVTQRRYATDFPLPSPEGTAVPHPLVL